MNADQLGDRRAKILYRWSENRGDDNGWKEEIVISTVAALFDESQIARLLGLLQNARASLFEIVIKRSEILDDGYPTSADLEVFLDFEHGLPELVYRETWSSWPSELSDRGRRILDAGSYRDIRFPALLPPSADQRQKLLRDGLSPLCAGEPDRKQLDRADNLFLMLDDLFRLILTESELLHENSDNPVEHHATVLSHMMEIAYVERFTWAQVRQTSAISLLHDNWPVKKITRQMRSAATTAEERAKLEELNLKYRSEHMAKGTENSRRRLHELNTVRRRMEFSDADIETICRVISIHDHPSINIPIPKTDVLTVAFREADRLWMQAPSGIRADLWRKGISDPTSQQCFEQARANLGSYGAERSLYSNGDETFFDQDTFFRTGAGYQIFRRYRDHWKSLGPLVDRSLDS